MVIAKSGEKLRNGNTSKAPVVTGIRSRDGIVATVKSMLALVAQPCGSLPSEGSLRLEGCKFKVNLDNFETLSQNTNAF